MNYEQNSDTAKLFGLVFVVIPVVYLAVRVLPYLLFYVVPVVLLSVVTALLWRTVTRFDENRFRGLVLVIPATLLAVLLLAGLPVETKVVGGYLVPNGEYFFNLFNSWNKTILHFLWTMTPMPFDAFFGLRPKVDSVLYDWNTVRWLIWISAGIGAPIAFSAWAWNHERLLKHKYEEILKAKLDEKDKDFSERKTRAQARFNALIQEKRELAEETRKLKIEAEKWKLLADFKAKTDSEPGEQKGVLDSDAL